MADTVISLSDDKLSTKHIHSAAESLRKAEKTLNNIPYAMGNSGATENSDGVKIFMGASADVEAIRTEAARLRAILEDCESILKSGPESLRDADKSFKGQFDPDANGIWKDIRERLLNAAIAYVFPAYAAYKGLQGLFSSKSQKTQVETISVSVEPIDNLPIARVITHEDGEIPSRAGIPITPPKTNDGIRSKDAYDEVLCSLNVKEEERYRRKGDTTYCNIYVWDATKAMGCEIPHYYNSATGEPMEYPNGTEMGPNGMRDWLITHGEEYGWHCISREEAIAHANAGQPTVAIDSGHVAMVAPQHDGDSGMVLAQAGALNSDHARINECWTLSDQANLKFFYHE